MLSNLQKTSCIVLILLVQSLGAEASTSQPQDNVIDIQQKLAKQLSSEDGLITLRNGKDVKTTIPIDPTWCRLVLRGRVKVDAITPGEKSWNTARISVLFRDDKQKSHWSKCPSWREVTDGWVRFEQVYEVPDYAKQILIGPAIYSDGCVHYADMQLVTLDEQAVRQADLPQEVKLWGREPIEVVSRTRDEICLNGVWAFVPALNQTEAVPQDGWGYIRVPGSWRPGSWRGWMPGIVARGFGNRWIDFGKGRNTFAAWYQRRIDIPEQWAGRHIALDFARVSTDAVVFVDGKRAGQVTWPTGEVDITQMVSPGQSAQLQVLVIGTLSEKETINYMGPNADQIIKTKAQLDNTGLIDDVILKSRPMGKHINDVFVVTSTRNKTLSLEVALDGSYKAQQVALTAEIYDAAGKLEKVFKSEQQLSDATNPKCDLQFQWDDPKLWDVGEPNLYTLLLTVQAQGLNDVYHQRFGFREFWIDGKRFYLNGKEIRFRPTSCGNNSPESVAQGMHEMIDQVIKGFMSMGFNIGELWPHDHERRGFVEFRPHWYDRADQLGFPLMGVALNMSQFAASWQEPGVKDNWQKHMQDELRRVRNHPSVLIWATSPNRFGHAEDQNPVLLGNKQQGFIDLPAWQKLAVAGEDACRLIKDFDPTRPVLVHSGSAVGDVYNVNSYLNFIPLQERMDWLSQWDKTGNMPLAMIEFGTPLSYSFFRQRTFNKISRSEPLMTEFCATYLGSDAYTLQRPVYRDAIAKLYLSDDLYRRGLSDVLCAEPAFQKLQTLFVKQTWRAWRTWGITGGMIPWSWASGWERQWSKGQTVTFAPFNPGRRGTYLSETTSNAYYNFLPQGVTEYPSGKTLKQNNGPTLAWIAGKPESFTEQSHHFAVGQQVNKLAVLLNDTRHSTSYQLRWLVQLNGQDIAKGEHTGKLDVAQTLFLPIHFEIPDSLFAQNAAGEVILTASIDGNEHHDTFDFTAHTKPHKLDYGKVYLFDPVGRTASLLEYLGVPTQPWRPAIKNGLLIIGQNALVEHGQFLQNVQTYIEQGGRVLLMAQDPQWVRNNTGLRVARHVSRRVFPVANHPLADQFNREELRDWTGQSRLLGKTHAPLPQIDSYLARCPAPKYGWMWGSQGAVSSCAIEKPHHSRWRPILECEFDLAYSPLMELDEGKGRMIWCSLDLEDQALVDPAADRVARKVLQYAAHAPLSENVTQATMLMGNASDASQLKKLGVAFETISAIPHKQGLLVIGSDVAFDTEKLEQFVNQGGRVLVLARQESDAPLGVKLQHVDAFAGSVHPPQWSDCRGMSVSDLRWRSIDRAWLLTANSADEQLGADGLLLKKTLGKGHIIFTQINPEQFDVEHKTYLRMTRWRQTRALSQLMANMGATFKSDQLIFAAKADDNQASQEKVLKLNGPWAARITDYKTATDSTNRYEDHGLSKLAMQAVSLEADTHTWQKKNLPSYWNIFGGKWSHALGEAVFRKQVQIPEQWQGRDLVLRIGPIDDMDDTYFNGELIGKTDASTPAYYSHPRVYTIPARLLRKSGNVIAIRVFNNYGDGGVCSDDQGISLSLKSEPGQDKTLPGDGYYCDDWRDDFALGDDPYRYKRW